VFKLQFFCHINVQLTTATPTSKKKVDSTSRAESRFRFKQAKRETAMNGVADVAAKRRSVKDTEPSSKRLSTGSYVVGDGDSTIASSNDNWNDGGIDKDGAGSSDTLQSSKTNLIASDLPANTEMFAY
jgi:hypothetical protein